MCAQARCGHDVCVLPWWREQTIHQITKDMFFFVCDHISPNCHSHARVYPKYNRLGVPNLQHVCVVFGDQQQKKRSDI